MQVKSKTCLLPRSFFWQIWLVFGSFWADNAWMSLLKGMSTDFEKYAQTVPFFMHNSDMIIIFVYFAFTNNKQQKRKQKQTKNCIPKLRLFFIPGIQLVRCDHDQGSRDSDKGSEPTLVYSVRGLQSLASVQGLRVQRFVYFSVCDSNGLSCSMIRGPQWPVSNSPILKALSRLFIMRLFLFLQV